MDADAWAAPRSGASTQTAPRPCGTVFRHPSGMTDIVLTSTLPVERRRSLLGDLHEIAVDELWKYRELLYQLMLRDIRIRYKQAVMGFAWAILMPALIVAAGTLVRFAMAYVGGGHVSHNAIAGMAVKALPWAFFVGAIGFATTSLTGNLPLVSKIYFPREVLPLSATLAQSFDSTIGAVTVGIALPLLGVHYGLTALWAPVLAVLIFCTTAGAALFLGCANLFFRDVKYIVQVLLTFGIFFTPVFFEPRMFGPLGARAMMLNPLAPLLEGLRLSVVEGHNLLVPLVLATPKGDVIVWSPWYLAYGAAWAILGLIASVLVFHRTEGKFAEYV
jgi:lipopolysaccharide transport system permease protein